MASDKERDVNVDRFRIKPGKQVSLADYDPEECAPFRDRSEADGLLEQEMEQLTAWQERLYAERRWSLLLVFQGMDGSGKDSIVKHVLRGLHPFATQAVAFKQPSSEDLDHDFLWRCVRFLPERGRIGIFNRSYYEEVLIVRVDPRVLAGQRLPSRLVSKKIWSERFEDINHFEQFQARNGTAIRKFYLNVSKDEQRRRFIERIDDPAKNWKFSLEDVEKRKQWTKYRKAYEDMLSATSTAHAPWYVVPADRKWFTRIVVARVVRETLAALDPKFPQLSSEQQAELAVARKELEK